MGKPQNPPRRVLFAPGYILGKVQSSMDHVVNPLSHASPASAYLILAITVPHIKHVLDVTFALDRAAERVHP
jgi:hypothetical protein